MRTTRRSFSCCFLLSLMLSLIAESSGHTEPMAVMGVTPRVGVSGDASLGTQPAKPMTLLRVGPRYGIGGDSPLGEEQKENFHLYDIAAVFKLPWLWRQPSTGWAFETRLIASGGELAAAGQTSFMGTLVPALALTSPNSRLSIDVGLGAGFFTNHRFGVQDFGGPAQIVGTAGIGFDVVSGFHAGYRFQHFSDAGMYGPTSLGVDMHIMDLSYKF